MKTQTKTNSYHTGRDTVKANCDAISNNCTRKFKHHVMKKLETTEVSINPDEMKQENPNMVYGRLAESVHISGYSLERAMREFEFLLEGNRWKAVGKGYEDINEFVRSLSFKEFKIAVEQRKKIAAKLKELEASQRATAEMLGVSKTTVIRDTGTNVPPDGQNGVESQEHTKHEGTNVPLGPPAPQKQLEQEREKDGTETELFSKSAKDLLSLAEQKDKKVHVSNNSGENEWYTPANIIQSAKAVMGTIDLDPATSERANETVQAAEIFTKDDSGLNKKWNGNVWLNPPYAQPLISEFSNKVVEEIGNFNQCVVLVNNATETIWLQNMMCKCDAVCFIKGRIKFIDVDGNPSGTPLQGQVVLYFGMNKKEFVTEFKQHGICTIMRVE